MYPAIEEGFLKKLIERKEFYQYYPRESIDFKFNDTFLTEKILASKKLQLHSYQNFVKNYINPSTEYKRLLIKWMTGIGKTLGALSITLPFVKYYSRYFSVGRESPYVFIIGFTKKIFQKELLRFSEFGFISQEELAEVARLRALADIGSELDKSRYRDYETMLKKRLSQKKIGGFYRFYGYQEFFNKLFNIRGLIKKLKLSETDDLKLTYQMIVDGIKSGDVKVNTEITAMFANSIIICDEIHNVYNTANINSYGIAIQYILDLFERPDDLMVGNTELYKTSTLRCVFLSATPLNNSPTEIVDLVNLLVPLNSLPDKKHITKQDLFIDERQFTPGAEDRLSKLLNGRVSYLSNNDPKIFPTSSMVGEEITLPKNTEGYTKIPYLKFIRCVMGTWQSKEFSKHFTGAVPTDGHAMLDIMFPAPEGSVFRTKDIVYTYTHNKEWMSKNGIEYSKDHIGGSFLTNISKYSAKYSTMLDTLLKITAQDTGKILIYHQYVKISGIKFIAELLRSRGFIDEFSPVNKNTICARCANTNKDHDKEHTFIPARFMLAYGDIDKNTLARSIEKYNSETNKFGYNYKIIIGSSLIQEAFDFNSIQHLMVLSSVPNISTLKQIIGRAIRNQSHIMLPEQFRHVNIYLFVTSSDKELSYEELKYFEKIKDYLVIQKIEKILHETAIDADINKYIIKPKEDNFDMLYFKPKELGISEKELVLTTFRAYHGDEEINTITYIIKRLFIEQSPIWEYDGLLYITRNPPFDVSVNTNLFLEENFIIALHFLTANSTDVDLYYHNKGIVDRLFDPMDKKIITKNGQECVITYHRGLYILLPIYRETRELQDTKYTRTNTLGYNIRDYQGKVIYDIDNWYRHPRKFENISFNITEYLRTSKESYAQLKLKFYNSYKDISIDKIPTTVEIYGFSFHIKFIEDSIRYVFNLLTDKNFKINEYNDFYLKMIYFYARLELIVFADQLTREDLVKMYSRYIGGKKPMPNKNQFLMTTISKIETNFNDIHFTRYNKYVEKRKTVRAPASMLPVGHMLSNNIGLAIPRFYNPKTDSWIDYRDMIEPYSRAYDIENDNIVGYYDKNNLGINLKFKLRSPIHKITIYTDTRSIERGSSCATRKKTEVKDIAKSLKIPIVDNVKKLCGDIKLKLMRLELDERRRYNNLSEEDKKKGKRIRYFYFHYEEQPI